MPNDLKLCPFCDGEAAIEQTGKNELTLRCVGVQPSGLLGCGAKFIQKAGIRFTLEWLAERMTETWNRRASPSDAERHEGAIPVAWVIPGDDNARPDGTVDAMAWEDGEFTRPLYASPPAAGQEPVAVKGAYHEGWSDAKGAHKYITSEEGCYSSEARASTSQSNPEPEIAAPKEESPSLELLNPADDEAIEWVTTNLMAVRRDDGTMYYDLSQVVRAFQAAKTMEHDLCNEIVRKAWGDKISVDAMAETVALRAENTATTARYTRLHRICERILWTDIGIPALDNEQTKAALSDLAELIFTDALIFAVAIAPEQEEAK